MTQALIEKENDPKVYCSVPKVITYLLHLYKSSFKPILPENFASHDTKKNTLPPLFLPNCPKYYLKRKILFFKERMHGL